MDGTTTPNELISRNPATGAMIRRLPSTPVEALPEMFSKARIAQVGWRALSVKKRTLFLNQFSETLLNRLDEMVNTISEENGKPRFEALANEILPVLELCHFFARHTKRVLDDKPIPLRIMKHRKSFIHYAPLGTVAVISPWNYPFLLPMGEILMALVCGNAVVFKPSEVTSSTGLMIQSLIEQAGLPSGVFQVAFGDGRVGAAMIQNRPDKIFFTGSVATGKRIMAAAAEHLIPVCLELGGKDPMLVLPDADLDFASSAALWGSFSNSGQVCASTERILVHESQRVEFIQRLKDKLARLRPSTDLGFITSTVQKNVYDHQIADAHQRGIELCTGGEYNADRTALAPIIATGPQIEQSELYREETFGPAVAVASYRTVDEAIKKANDSPYGLLASVISKNTAFAEGVARQIDAGTVTVNEVTYTAGLPETPWGGMKNSGFGRKHSEMGLLEFVHTKHIHKPRAGFLVFKSWWWFPYTPFQYETFRSFLGLYRQSFFARLKALPHLLWNMAQFLKNEPRI